MNDSVLLIDDDPELLAMLRLVLEREGLAVTVSESGQDGLREAHRSQPDLIILDIMMPKMDGWTTCNRLRQKCEVPIILLTASAGAQQAVKGPSTGADDFVSKPFYVDELVARVRAVLRRARTGSRGGWRAVFDNGVLRIDFGAGTVTGQRETVHLTPTELRLLLRLASRAGCVVSHKDLLAGVWGPEHADKVGYLSVHIRHLREKLEEDPASPRHIHTRSRMGYCFSGSGTFRVGAQ